MRQVVRAHENVAARNCHVFSQLTLDRKVRLVRIGVLEILFDVQSKRQHRTKSGERLIIETLPAELILSSRSGARRAIHAGNSTRKVTNHHGALEHLRCIEERRWSRTTLRCQDSLLLL